MNKVYEKKFKTLESLNDFVKYNDIEIISISENEEKICKSTSLGSWESSSCLEESSIITQVLLYKWRN